MSHSALTLTDLETICRDQVSVRSKTGWQEFQPTANQVYFFTLVWLLKLQKKRDTCLKGEDLVAGQKAATLTGRAGQVTQHLGEWGMTITGLKDKDEKEWELLRLQLQKAVKSYPGPSAELRADALQNALLKMFNLLDKMVGWLELEETDVLSRVLNTQASLTNIYDFGSPFYAFAKRIARNELITQLRKESRQPAYPIPLDDMSGEWLVMSPAPLLEELETSLETFRLQLKIDLVRLLEIIQQGLTPKPRQVILYTLAARPQFWRALQATGLPVLEGFSPDAGLSLDVDIAQTLAMDENSIRVHRANAKKVVQAVDPILGLLLESLLTRRGRPSYNSSINVAKSVAL